MSRSIAEMSASALRFLSALRGGGRGWILLFVSVGWLVVLGGRIVYPALLPLIVAEFAIDYATAGVLVGVLWAAYALMQFPGGVIADVVGERAILTLSLVLALGGLLAVVLAPSFLAFVAATAVFGVGTGLFGTTRVTVLSDTYPDRSTTAISLNQASGNVGNAILPVVAGAVAAAFGWRFGFGYLLPLFAIAAVGVWRTVPHHTSEPSGQEVPLSRTARRACATVRDPRVSWATAVLCLLMFLYQSVTGFLTAYLVEVKQLSPGTAATLYGVFFGSAIFVQFVSGTVSDRYGQRTALTGFLALSVPAFALVTVADGVPGVLATVVLLSTMLGGFPPVHAYTVAALPSEVQGSGYGLLRTLYIAFGATGPPLVGALADAQLFDEAFLFLGGVAVFAVLASTRVPAPE